MLFLLRSRNRSEKDFKGLEFRVPLSLHSLETPYEIFIEILRNWTGFPLSVGV
jgi:hypothetical protein